MKKKMLLRLLSLSLCAAISVSSLPVTAAPVNNAEVIAEPETIDVSDILQDEDEEAADEMSEETTQDAKEESDKKFLTASAPVITDAEELVSDEEDLADESVSSNEVATLEDVTEESTENADDEAVQITIEETEPENEFVTDGDITATVVEAKGGLPEILNTSSYSFDDLLGMDIYAFTEDELAERLSYVADEDLYTYLKTLSQEDYDYVTSMRFFERETTITYYDVNTENGSMKETAKEEPMTYFESLEYRFSGLRAVTFSKSSGYFSFGVTVGGANYNGRVTISNISTSKHMANQIPVTMTVTQPSCPAGFGANCEVNSSLVKANTSSAYYSHVKARITFASPIGYNGNLAVTGNSVDDYSGIYFSVGSTAADGINPNGSQVVTYHQNNTKWLCGYVSITRNAGVGSSSYSNPTNGRLAVSYTPVTYSVNYGGSVVSNLYGTAHTAPGAANLSRTISYNTDGGSTCSPTGYTRTFAYWSVPAIGNVAAGSTVNPGAYSYTGTAIYNTGTVTLPSTSKSYTVTYNGGNSGTPKQANSTTSVAFNGWYSGSTRVGGAGQTWSGLEGDATLTAGWGAANAIKLPGATPTQYTVSFDSDGGSAVTSKTTNRTFAGWSGAGAEGASYVPTGNVTLTATYSNESITLPSVSRTHKITYNANGGSVNKTSENVSMPFNGWYDGTIRAGLANSSYTPSANKTLTAKWGVKSIALPTATKTGYTLKGWSDGTTTKAAEGSYYVTSDKTLKAVWSANEYVVQFHNNNGGADATTSQAFTYDTAQALKSISGMSSDFAKPSYHFAGWATSPTGTAVYTDGQSVKNLTDKSGGTVNLYAVWVPDSYDVTFVYGNGTADETKTINYDEEFTVPAAEKNLTAEYILDGGYIKGSNETTKSYPFALLGYKRSDDESAKLIQPGTQKNLSTGGAVTLTAQYDGSNIVITLPDAEKSGYNFKGWTVEGISNPAIESTWKAAGSKIYLNTTEFDPTEHPDEGTTTKYSYFGAQESLDTILANTKIKITANWKIREIPPTPIIIDNSGNNNVDLSEIQDQINGIMDSLTDISSTSQMTEQQLTELKSLIQTMYSMDSYTANTLIDFITNCSTLSEDLKVQILKALASGSISEELKAQLIAAIMVSNDLTDAQKAQLIAALNKMSSLSLEDQKKILNLLTNGSSAVYTIDGIVYKLQKNADGSLTIALQALNGKKDIVIPDQITVAGNTYAITQIGAGAFKGNTTIETVKMGNNITSIGDSAFEGCKNLKSIALSGSLTSIGKKAFKGCTSLTKISIPATCKTIGESAFEGCTALKTVTLRDGLIQIGSKAFYKCSALTKIKIPKTTLKIGSYAFSSCKKLASVTFATNAQLTEMGTGIFSNDIVLKKIKLPGKLTMIPTKAFYNCKKLSSVTGGKNITKVGAQSFEKCIALKSITLQSRVQIIYKKAFYGCKNLKTVVIKSKALTTVGSKAFKGCKKGIKFKVPNPKIPAYTKLLKGKY